MKKDPKIKLHRLLTVAVLIGQMAGLPAVHAVPAFPGAIGAGANTTGGRPASGLATIFRVTNLNPGVTPGLTAATTSGSLADALSYGNRIVLIEVSGIIDLTNYASDGVTVQSSGKIRCTASNITLLGQTATGEGICLKGGALQFVGDDDASTIDGNIILRHIRSRRGFVINGDTGDSIMFKQTGASTAATKDLRNIYVDHCSASWATDENLTVTNVSNSTVERSIASEGLDYTNPPQTPPNHAFGSLWGSTLDNGEATMGRMLYAHNRLRNPRATAGGTIGPVQTLYNSVIYNWNEAATHTGDSTIRVNWVNNYYKGGINSGSYNSSQHQKVFRFDGTNQSRVYAEGNWVNGDNTPGTQNNGVAVGLKGDGWNGWDLATMIVDEPLGTTQLPVMLSALDASSAVLSRAGAYLPSRDHVDMRIVNSVRNGTGAIINKETDLPVGHRWPTYISLTKAADSDGDGVPDFWAAQYGLSQTGSIGRVLSNGYANVEHYANNSLPNNSLPGGVAYRPIVSISATVSRAVKDGSQTGILRLQRTGDSTAAPLQVKLSIKAVDTNAFLGTDYSCALWSNPTVQATVTIPSGSTILDVSINALSGATQGRKVAVQIDNNGAAYYIGCPYQSLIVMRNNL